MVNYMRDMTESELKAVYDDRECPFCGEKGFYPGPCGGMMMNISFKCGGKLNIVNPDCWDNGFFPRVGQVLEEPAGYVPKKSLPLPVPALPVPIVKALSNVKKVSRTGLIIIIQLSAVIIGGLLGWWITETFPEVMEFVDIQFKRL
jgi:hypothetical protein